MLLLLGLVAQILIQARMHVKPLGCTGGDVHYAVFQRQNCAHACSVCSLTIAQPGRNMADAKAEEAFSSNHGNKKTTVTGRPSRDSRSHESPNPGTAFL